MLLRALAVCLAFLRRVDPGDANAVLLVRGIEHGYGVAVRDGDDAAGELRRVDRCGKDERGKPEEEAHGVLRKSYY